MKTGFLKIAIKRILIVVIVGFALTSLAGCGTSHSPYRHGNTGRNYHNNTDYYRGSCGYSDDPSAAPEHNPGNRGSGSMMGYDSGRSVYCR